MAGGIYYSPARARPLVHEAQLTVRGHEALQQIARALALSVRTVETHRLHIKIEGQAEPIKYAVEHAHLDGAAR